MYKCSHCILTRLCDDAGAFVFALRDPTHSFSRCCICACLFRTCRIDHQCPRGWWGSPTCGPCDCDTDKGFDPNCNKTSGHCHCKVSWKHTARVLSLISSYLFRLTAVDSFLLCMTLFDILWKLFQWNCLLLWFTLVHRYDSEYWKDNPQCNVYMG